MGEIRVCVSHEALMSDLSPLGQSNEGKWMDITIGRGKKAREIALNDVKRKLDSRPVKLKPT